MKRSERTWHPSKTPDDVILISARSLFVDNTPGISIMRSFTAPLGGRRRRGAASALTCRRGREKGNRYATGK